MKKVKIQVYAFIVASFVSSGQFVVTADEEECMTLVECGLFLFGNKDTDASGGLSAAEANITQETMSNYDQNQDGELSWPEYWNAIQSNAVHVACANMCPGGTS